MRCSARPLGPFLGLLLAATQVLPALADDTASARALVSQVGARLNHALAADPDVGKEHPHLWVTYLLATEGDTLDSAYATSEAPSAPSLVVCRPYEPIGKRAAVQAPATQVRVAVVVGAQLVTRVCEGSAARMAVILGHELAHVTLGHLTRRPSPQSDTLDRSARERELEFAADRQGVSLAAAAGYANAVAAATDTWLWLGEVYGTGASLDPRGALSDHPTNLERIAALQTDPAKQRQWQAALAFEAGVCYLQLGEWEVAQTCFEVALLDFPNSPETLTNLGYAKMMRYYAMLPAADRDRLGGEVSCLAFVTRPPVIVRGALDDTPLREAIQHYQQALRLVPDFRTAQGNLAAALLMNAAAPAKDVEEAAHLLEGVLAAFVATPETRGLLADAAANLALARRRLLGPTAAPFREALGLTPVGNVISPAFKANFGALLAGSDQRADWEQAESLLAEYLRQTAPTGYYHQQAARRWVQVRGKLGLPTSPVPAPRHTPWLAGTSVPLPKGGRLFLREPWAQACAALRPYPILVTPTDKLLGNALCRCPALGLSLRLSRGTIRAIVLDTPAAPALTLKSDQTGTGPRLWLKVGNELQTPEQLGVLTDPLTIGTQEFRLYRQTNVALRLEGRRIRALALISG